MDFSEWLRTLDWSPLFISIKTGIIAVFISFFFRNICGVEGCSYQERISGCA